MAEFVLNVCYWIYSCVFCIVLEACRWIDGHFLPKHSSFETKTCVSPHMQNEGMGCVAPPIVFEIVAARETWTIFPKGQRLVRSCRSDCRKDLHHIVSEMNLTLDHLILLLVHHA